MAGGGPTGNKPQWGVALNKLCTSLQNCVWVVIMPLTSTPPAQTLLCSTLLLSWHHSQQFNTTAHEVMCTVNLPAELWERILLSSCLIGSRRKLYDEHLRRLIRVCQALSCRAVTPLQTVKAGSLSD